MRITPLEVQAAYAYTGMKPLRGSWGGYRDGVLSGCGLATIATAAGEFDRPSKWVTKNYGDSYRRGFVRGFDGGASYCTNDEVDQMRWRQGYDDGKAAALAVFQEDGIHGRASKELVTA